jgi:hypothetical protein
MITPQSNTHDMEETDKPAFPTNARMHSDAQGLTKREYFAALFMQSMCAGEGAVMVANRDKRYDETNWKEVVAMNAIEFADALLEQLAKSK